MRRLIAYITTALAMLLAIGVAATPVITRINAGREFTSSTDYREIVFNVDSNESSKKNKIRSDEVAAEMRKRLDNYNIEDYSVKVQGDDKVAVAFAANSSEFNYAAKYLSFSGGDFSFVGSNGTIKNGGDLFKTSDIHIEYKGDANVPTIVMPVTTKAKKYIKDLCKEMGVEEKKDDDSSKAGPIKRDGESEESSTDTPKNIIYLWSNLDESREEGYDLLVSGNDPVSREKVLMGFDAENIWYEDSKEKQTEIFFVCAKAKEDDNTQLDISGLKDDNARANYLVNMLKASKYEFDLSCSSVNISKEGYDYYKNARILSASGESLLDLGTIANIKMSKTFIATAIAIVIIALLLVVYFRVNALAMIATSLGTLFLTLVSFTSMHVLFNIPAVIGFVILAGGVLFGEIFYASRFKEEVYKGRSIKKANQEASKKSNLVTIDSAIVLAFSGLMMYALGGSALKPLGVVLFFGAVFVLLMNLLVFKLLMYLVTNSTNLQQKYKVFNIDEEKVPNILVTEEKPAYEAPYEKTDFTKKKSLFAIICGALSAAALACIVTFGIISPSHSPLNVEKATSDTTVVYVSISEEGKSKLDNFDGFWTQVFDGTSYKYNDVKNSISGKTDKPVSQYVYESETEQHTDNFYYFTVTLDENLSSIKLGDLEDKLNDNLYTIFLTDHDGLTKATVRNSKELTYAPNQGFVALATGLSIVGVTLYFAFRFRPSRAVALLVTTTGATLISYGAIVAMRFVGTTAITSVAMPLVAITMMLASIFYFSTEKAMLKEGHLELTPEVRKEMMVKALGKSAGPLFIFVLISLYVAINFFGFGLENTVMLFASAIIGEIVAVIMLLTLLGPLSDVLGKLFGKIHLPKLKFLQKDKEVKKQTKRNSSEPEETIFIGIND